MCEGAACFIEVAGVNPYRMTWGGFWDKDHHVWLTTEFHELIDLTISQLHLHPVAIDKRYNNIPAIWWSPIDISPSCFRYLPSKFNIYPKLEGQDELDMNAFLLSVDEFKKRILNGENIETISDYILEGLDSLSYLLSTKDHWAMGAYFADQKQIPFPDWIVNREAELMRNYS